MLLEKTKTLPFKPEVLTAKMVATEGYSLSLVGKSGVKTIFQAIRRANLPDLVGDVVQRICDEFCNGYVVTRVRAAREETGGGPFMDVGLLETVQTLQDLKLRHLMCTFETIDEQGENVQGPAQKAFAVLMENASSSRKVLPALHSRVSSRL